MMTSDDDDEVMTTRHGDNRLIGMTWHPCDGRTFPLRDVPEAGTQLLHTVSQVLCWLALRTGQVHAR